MSSCTLRISTLLRSNQFGQKIVRSFSITTLQQNSKDLKIGFLGTGRIAQAIIVGLIKQKKIKPEQIYASDTNLDYLKYLKEKCPTFSVSSHFKASFFVINLFFSSLFFNRILK